MDIFLLFSVGSELPEQRRVAKMARSLEFNILFSTWSNGRENEQS